MLEICIMRSLNMLFYRNRRSARRDNINELYMQDDNAIYAPLADIVYDPLKKFGLVKISKEEERCLAYFYEGAIIVNMDTSTVVYKKSKFFRVLQDVFCGQFKDIEGQSAVVKLMKIKSNYYQRMEKAIEEEMQQVLKVSRV